MPEYERMNAVQVSFCPDPAVLNLPLGPGFQSHVQSQCQSKGQLGRLFTLYTDTYP